MHDPLTVAFEIRAPWYRHKPWPKKARSDPDPWRLKREWEKMPEEIRKGRDQHWPNGYRDSLFTIWHKDPELRGNDNSCGFGYVCLSRPQVNTLKNAAWSEGNNPHFLCCREKEWDGTITEAEALYRGLVFLVCRCLHLKITFDQAAKYASEAMHIIDTGKFGSQFCFLPGYHTNSTKDTADERQDHFHIILCAVARVIITDRRPWYRHPRWHIHHWRIQWHWGQKLYRFLFSRCCICGKRFSKWGDTNVISNWDGDRIWHGECDRTLRPK